MSNRLKPWLVCGLCFIAASLTFAAPEPKSIHWYETGPFQHADGSGPYRKSQELLRHLRNLKRIAAAGPTATAPSSQSADIGDVAVIVDNGRILIPPRPANPFDLPLPSGLRFDPGSTANSSTASATATKSAKKAGGDPAPTSTNSFTVSATATPLDPSFGADLNLGDDDAKPAQAADDRTFNGGTGFSFLGNSYTTDRIFVGSDGHITFGAPDAASTTRDAARHIGGPPRVSPFFNDLDPSVSGSVHVDVRADRIVVTWNALPEFGTTNSNTLQAVLWASGVIDFVYSDLDAQFAVVGVAEGNDEGPINEIDLSSALPVTLEAGAIFEEFTPAIIIQQMDVVELAQEFYKTHLDQYDYLVMFTDDVVDIGFGAFAFNLTVHSDTEGLGFYSTGDVTTRFDRCDAVGLPSGCELESVLNMNRIGLYWPDEAKLVDPPIKKFRFFCLNQAGQIVPCGATLDGPPGSDQISRRARWAGTLNGDFGSFGSYTLGLNSAMSIMGQEAGHRWLAFPAINHPVTGIGPDNADLLGRSLAHWSWFFNVRVPNAQFGGDPRASSAEGNAIQDLGPSSLCIHPGERLFLTERNELIDGFTTLDQYFMGVRLPGDVGPFWYIDRPTRAGTGVPFPAAQAGASAQDDRLICGQRVDLTLNNITDVGDVLLPFLDSNGTRDPLIGDEQDAGPGITGADDAACTKTRRCVDVKTMAFILLVSDGPPDAEKHAGAIQQVDNFRRVWEEYGNGPAVGGRGARGVVGAGNYIKKFDTSLNPAIR